MREIYFAYGSCMSERDLRRTTPSARFLAPALLQDHALTFPIFAPGRGGGVANATPREGSTVQGILWAIEESESLDEREHHPHIYQRTSVKVQSLAGEEIEALTYIIRPELEAGHFEPSNDYLKLLYEGVELGIPLSYLEDFGIPTE